jgi:hypothetical protein
MPPYLTPYERGDRNQTTTWDECIAWYERLAADFPAVLRFYQIGVSDNGVPLHAGVVTADGEFDRARLKAEGRCVFFNNNGIHPGEPEGIDGCMALVRDFCTQPLRLSRLGATVFLFIPVYNVDGCLNRNTSSRVNQVGPESFGFRGTGRNLDLNRDFIKCDSLAAQAFSRFFSDWDPDVMVDTHTSNGADYAYTMTLIHTQSDKLGGTLGAFLRDDMVPAIYQDMAHRGWPTCPYVHPIKDTPDDGIAHMMDVPRFSTGYAALHYTIGFMPESHMLKPFADRYVAMRALVESVLDFTLAHADTIAALRRDARLAAAHATQWPVQWKIDASRPSMVRFKGFQAVRSPSKLGNYTRLSYDRNQPWEKDIAVYQRCVETVVVTAPRAYLIPQAWQDVIARLQWNGVRMHRLATDRRMEVRAYRIVSVLSRTQPYEGRMFHDDVQVVAEHGQWEARAGDCLVELDQPNARYAVETLEPQALDSFFRWGFFNSVLERKERYSDYVFEDTALELLQEEPELQALFDQWKASHPDLLGNQAAVLDFLFAHCRRHCEPGWMRYPVLALMRPA